MVDASSSPLSGLYRPNGTDFLYYGTNCVQKYLISTLPSKSSKAFIVTGNSLASKTPIISKVEELLKADGHFASTFSNIKQHAPVADLEQATELVKQDDNIDTIISIGGGSPIDSAKAISYYVHEKKGRYLYHITVPTTLSAAECTAGAGFTTAKGIKTGIRDPNTIAKAVFYDPEFARYTPQNLWLGTGMRAVDHAMELMYHPQASEVPCRSSCLFAASQLFRLLPAAKQKWPVSDDVITETLLAAWASLAFLGSNVSVGLGLSHGLGYALGSPYGIPHGETSCLTLGLVLKLKAETDPAAAKQIARMYPYISSSSTSQDSSTDVGATAAKVGDEVIRLVESLGMRKGLRERGIGEDQVDVIVQRALGRQDIPEHIMGKVKELVKSLYE